MNWFFASGDAPYFFQEQLSKLTLFPDVWRGQEELGVSSLSALWIDYPFRLVTVLLSKLGFSWFVIDKLWWGLVFFLSLYGAYKLAEKLHITQRYRWISSLVYSANTYVMLLFDGGQLGVALAYAFVPLVLKQVLSYTTGINSAIRTGLFLSILVFLDIRIAFVFVVLCVPLLFITLKQRMLCISKFTLLIPVVVFGINTFWLLPTILYRDSLASLVAQTSSGGSDLSFFSVADFPHALSLLHPNYPENLFGKVYFFKPEFLFIPIFAFSFFLFTKKNSLYSFFGGIGLLGAFLGKGAQGPFGEIYMWLFNNIPGFFLFRDPTKWYMLTAVSYSVLIPGTLEALSKKINYSYIHVTVFLLFSIFWIFSLRFVFLGNVTGNVTPEKVTKDYELLKDVLIEDVTFGRTLWLPTIERFGYTSELHPAVSARTILPESSPSGITDWLRQPETLDTIPSAGIFYIIVPEDIEQRIFIEDYTFNRSMRNDLVAVLDSMPQIQKDLRFNNLAVYRIQRIDQGLFMTNDGMILGTKLEEDSWTLSFPDRTQEFVLYVRFAYDPNWRLQIGDKEIFPIQSDRNFMHFIVPSGLERTGTIRYKPTQVAKVGAVVSFMALFITTWLAFLLRKS